MSKIQIYIRKNKVMIIPWIYRRKDQKDLKEHLVKLGIEMVKTKKNQIVYLEMYHHKEVKDKIMK